MALNYNTLTALINKRYLPTMYNQIFTDNHYLWALLKQKAKTYNDRKIVVPLEYGKSTAVQFTDRFDVVQLKPEEIATGAEYDPKMLTGSIVIPLEDELVSTSKMAVQNLITAKVKNLKKSIEESCAEHLWTRGTTLSNSKGWNTIDFLINDASTTVGNIAVSDASWWKSNMIDVSGSDYSYDPTVEASLVNPASDVYLLKLIRRGIAKCKYLDGAKPDVIVVPQYIYDLIEGVLEERKQGSKLNDKAASMGFDALDYRGVPIVADDDMVAAQTGDTDGRMYFINTEYLYLFFNSGAKFKAQPFVQGANQNAKSSLVNAYGNLVISNRRAQTCFTGLRSPQSYAA